MDGLAEENRVLRARVAQLEAALAVGADPLLRSLAEHAASFLVVVDPEGRFLDTGRQSERFGSVIGRQVFEFVAPEYVEPMRAVFARVVATGQAESYESVGYGEDGSPGHTYLTRVVPLTDQGVVTALVMVPTDITERVRLERSLEAQEQALRLAVEATQMGMWRWDVAENVIVWDPRMLELFGVTATPPDYDAYLSLVHPDDRALVGETVGTALQTGVYRSFEHRTAERPGLPSRWILGVGSVVRGPEGRPVRVMGGAVDITEQKQAAARNLRAERVETIGQLTAGMAHNFNNLLAAILPNLEFALHSGGEEQREHLTVALDASLQARDLVRSLMSLTRRGDPGPQTACAAEVIARMEDMCRRTFPREIRIHHRVEGAPGRVAMGVRDLEQVLLNLLFNARDALEGSRGEAREIEIVLARVAAADGSPRVELRVTDTGVGMTEEFRARVFEPFFTTKPPHRGSGLGLANAVLRVREASGTLDCESTPGVGTTFRLRLPEAAADAATGPSPGDTAPARVAATVLLADDEPVVRRVVRQVLTRDGCVVLEAGSAEEARALLRREGGRIELVVLDQSMPQESGVDALPSLRSLTGAPVVLFTGMAPSLPPGIAAVLEKPARPDEISRVVREVLAAARGDGPGAG